MNYIYIGEIYDNTGIYIYIAHVAKLVAVLLKSALLANRILVYCRTGIFRTRYIFAFSKNRENKTARK